MARPKIASADLTTSCWLIDLMRCDYIMITMDGVLFTGQRTHSAISVGSRVFCLSSGKMCNEGESFSSNGLRSTYLPLLKPASGANPVGA